MCVNATQDAGKTSASKSSCTQDNRPILHQEMPNKDQNLTKNGRNCIIKKQKKEEKEICNTDRLLTFSDYDVESHEIEKPIHRTSHTRRTREIKN
jgi:hypothetical protein